MFAVEDFTEEELIWFKPFSKTETVIYTSEKGEKDTIIFNSTEIDSESVRNFERGYYDTKYLTVPYILTNGSYHKSALMSDGKNRYTHHFANFSKSSSYSNLEITFIGLLFGQKQNYLEKVNDSTYFFSNANADYSGMNVEKGIKNFTFNTRLGIVEFVDDRNIKWKRD
ncbi:MAG: hypothetical protein CFE21_11345 [Bacteroidetes bacterium B1(2017)]|nr:MAG: hypothetical protein CFE21_11345 [Bacteroidetes bacterium B1(2017)]